MGLALAWIECSHEPTLEFGHDHVNMEPMPGQADRLRCRESHEDMVCLRPFFEAERRLMPGESKEPEDAP